MSNAKVYSYLRFSDLKQASGSSVDRQTAYAQRWAAEHGMVLDVALSIAHFAERDRSFRQSVTDAEMLHG